MTFSLLRTLCLALGRLFFVWPALLTGGVMLVMVFLSYQGGVVSRLDYYTYEAARWRNAPEGSLMVRRCIDAADNAVSATSPGVISGVLTGNIVAIAETGGGVVAGDASGRPGCLLIPSK